METTLASGICSSLIQGPSHGFQGYHIYFYPIKQIMIASLAAQAT
jgi:hypothetical protein